MMKNVFLILGVICLAGLVTSAFWGKYIFLNYLCVTANLADVDSDGDGLTDVIDDDDDNDGYLDSGLKNIILKDLF